MMQASLPLVTIITVAYNSAKTISRTIESVLNQTYLNIEYIIIDGASTDKTVEIAKSYQEKTNRPLLILSEPDNGMYDALNKGAKLAHGFLVGQINADDWYEADAVETMVKLYAKENYDIAWGSIRIKKATRDIIKHAKNSKFYTTTGWCHPAAFSKREILLTYPYICESMYDDFEYLISVKQAGRKIVVIDKIISNFSFGGMSTKKSFREVKKRISISKVIYQKHGLSKLYIIHRWIVELLKYILG